MAIPLLARNEYERVDLDRRPPVYDGSTRSTEHDHLVTFNGIVVSLDLLDRVGALREDLYVGLEDRDFARRLAGIGGRLVVSRRVLGIHPTRGNGRFPEPIAPERLYYSVRNQFISRREIGERPGSKRVAGALGAASRAIVTGDPASAAARLRGLRDGSVHTARPRECAARHSPRRRDRGHHLLSRPYHDGNAACVAERHQGVPFPSPVVGRSQNA